MIQILCADISQISRQQYAALYQAASPTRQHRADQCRNSEDALRCILAEVLLRTALKRVYGRWEDFSLAYGAFGKPRLAEREDFHFSISHSGTWVVLAFGKTNIGVDIQKISEEKARPAIAKRFFTQEEQAYLLTRENYAAAFTQIWTGKESYLKYLGTGLSTSLTSFSVFSPEADLHYFWDTLGDYSLCLCTRETDYQTEILVIKNAPA